MMDRAFEPTVRRKKPDNTSQSSSKKEVSNQSDSSSTRQGVKKLYKDEPTGNEQNSEQNPAGQGFSKTKAKTGGIRPKQVESQQQIASPAIKNIKMARVPLTVQDMKNSNKLNMRQSARFMQASGLQKKPEEPIAYKIQLIVFLLVSLVLLVNAMSPARKAPRRR